MVYQYNDITGHNYILIFFTESDGQTLKNFKRENKAADLKGSKQNFQLSNVVNIPMLCLLLYSASYKSHDYQHISLF